MIYPDSKVLLQVSGLCASVNGIAILKDLDLTVRSGEVHAIMGLNGSGKSTFLSLLSGRLKPDLGSVLIDGAIKKE